LIETQNMFKCTLVLFIYAHLMIYFETIFWVQSRLSRTSFT